MADNHEELNKIEVAKQKLSTMEKSIKNKAEEVDDKLKELHDKENNFDAMLAEKEKAIAEKEEALLKKVKVTDSGDVYLSMVKTVNELYDAYYSIKGSDEGLLEAMQSILSARQSVTK